MTERHQKLNFLFSNRKIIKKIQIKMPELFQLAEIESSRAGKIGMEIGSIRERIIIALLMSEFGESNIMTDIPITEPEMDCLLYSEPVSIKTFTSKNISPVKLIWTVDATKANKFKESYFPKMSLLVAQINWNGIGFFFYFPVQVQQDVFNKIGRNEYIKLPKVGTNSRGVELKKSFDRTSKTSRFWNNSNSLVKKRCGHENL